MASLGCALLGLLLVTGCAAPNRPATSVDLTAPGWVVRQGQAVWRSEASATDLAGELLLATHPNGGAWLQFAKPPVELASAVADADGWRLCLPIQRRTLHGRFDGQSLPGWVELLDRHQGHAGTAGWRFASKPGGHWELIHDSTGERLEGFLNP